jgi:hypothetical protein
VVSGSGAGIPACWGFTHSCARNDDDDDDNVVVIFAVVDGRGAQRWSLGSLGAIGDVGGLTQLARSPFLPLLIPSPITLPPSAPWLPLSVVRDGHWMVFGRVRSGRKMNMEQTDPNTGLRHLAPKTRSEFETPTNATNRRVCFHSISHSINSKREAFGPLPMGLREGLRAREEGRMGVGRD